MLIGEHNKPEARITSCWIIGLLDDWMTGWLDGWMIGWLWVGDVAMGILKIFALIFVGTL